MTDYPVLPDDMRPKLHEFLRSQSTLALGTAGLSDGRPQVAALFFASDDAFNLNWISDPDSRHSKNLEDWNDVSAAIYVQTWEYGAIKGVQIEGDASAVTDDDERQHALALYSEKFPFVTDRFATLIQQSVFYVVRPRWLRWIDNERKFGYKQEFSLDTDSDDTRSA